MVNGDFFYISSTEGYDLENPRKCFIKQRLSTEFGKDLLLVEIDPPFLGTKYGLQDENLRDVIVSARYIEDSITDIKEWPVSVYVAQILNKVEDDDRIVNSVDLKIIAWAEIYLDEDSAQRKSST